MTRTRKLLLGGLVVAAVAAGVVAASAHRGEWRHGGRGGHGGGFSMTGFVGPLCDGRGAEMADIMAVRLENRLKTTEAQKPALDNLKAAMKAGAIKVEASCPKRGERAADGTPAPRPTPPERLANLEAGLAARLEAVRSVRPAADAFYATLSDEQKQTLARMGEKRGRWFGRDRGDGEHREPRGADRPGSDR